MVDREKLMTTLQYRINEARNKGSKVTTIFISTLSDCMTLLKEQQQQIWELQEQEEYLTDKLKKQEAVVRCKDCIYGKHEKNESTGMEWIYCAHHRENRPNEWFCASGLPTIKQEGR